MVLKIESLNSQTNLKSKLFNFEHDPGSLFDIKRAPEILLKSAHLNIWCNLFIDPWGDRIEVNPLNLYESQEPLKYRLDHDFSIEAIFL